MRRSDEMTSSSTSAASAASGSQVTPARRSVGIIIVVLMAACLLFVGSYVQKLGEKAAVEAQIVAMQQQIEGAKVRTAILSKELVQANDEAHVAAIARDSLNLVQEGDQLIAIVDSVQPAAPAAAAQSARRPVDANPNWQRWFDLLFPGN
jgi:cell division protein FtsB